MDITKILKEALETGQPASHGHRESHRMSVKKRDEQALSRHTKLFRLLESHLQKKQYVSDKAYLRDIQEIIHSLRQNESYFRNLENTLVQKVHRKK